MRASSLWHVAPRLQRRALPLRSGAASIANGCGGLQSLQVVWWTMLRLHPSMTAITVLRRGIRQTLLLTLGKAGCRYRRDGLLRVVRFMCLGLVAVQGWPLQHVPL